MKLACDLRRQQVITQSETETAAWVLSVREIEKKKCSSVVGEIEILIPEVIGV